MVKKFLLTMFWRYACYLVKIEAIEDANVAFLVYTPALVWMVMAGRVLQASSDNLLLSIALEAGALGAEVMEAAGESST